VRGLGVDVVSKRMIGIVSVTVLIFFALETFHLIDVYRADWWPLLLFIFGIMIHLLFFKRGANEEEAFLLLPGGIFVMMAGTFFLNVRDPLFIIASYLLAFAFGLFEWWVFGKQQELKVPMILFASYSLSLFIESAVSLIYLFFIAVVFLVFYIFRYRLLKNERADVQ
jgi:hypothetical protein